MKAAIGSASSVGNCTVFSIGGNKCRLIARIIYVSQKVFVLRVMTDNELIQAFPLASIKSDKQLAAAAKVMDALLAKGELDEGEEMYLDAISDLVAAFEDQHHAIGPASDADMLRHFMDAKGVTQAELARDTKIAKSTVSEVLAGKRPFTRQMIRKLADNFRIDVTLLAGNL